MTTAPHCTLFASPPPTSSCATPFGLRAQGTPGSDCSRCDNSPKPAFTPPCPNCDGINWNVHAVRDLVKVPATLPAGKYVLGFRYDCETSAQVWQSCADVKIFGAAL